jgi:hypothetical protein
MLPRSDSVTVRIFSVSGSEVIEPIKGFFENGHHSIIPKLDNVPSGVYFYQIRTTDTTMTRRMMLLK